MINPWLSELGLDTGIAPNYNSPYNSNKISSKQVMRIMKKISTKGLLDDPIPNSPI